MKMIRLTLLVPFFILFVVSARAAEQLASVDAFINGLVKMGRMHCSEGIGARARPYQNRGDLLGAFQIEQAEKMICECVPGRLTALQARLSETERGEKMSESAFMKKYFSEVQNHCAGEQMQSMFAGACHERFAKRVPDSAQFCSCMKSFTSQLSSAQAAQLGLEASDYTSLAMAAKKNGNAPPAPPPLLKSMMEAQKRCAGS